MTKVLNFLIIVCLLISVQNLSAQTEKFFQSDTGGFSINLSRHNGVSGNGTIGGISFSWQRPEAAYEVGFYEIEGLSLAKIDGNFSFEETVKRYFNKFSAKGERIYAKEIVLDENSGREYKYKTATSIFILRLYPVGDRIYKILAEIALKNQSQEESVRRILDSFRLLDRTTAQAAIAKKLADATPKDLPQSPIVAKLKSDTEDRNLKGSVKSVLTEQAFYGLNDSLKKKRQSILEEFSDGGRITKKIEFDSYGNPYKVQVYGYIAGKNVSRIGKISYKYDLGLLMLEAELPGKADDRFDESYTYKYAADKLIEEKTFLSNGMLSYRFVYNQLKGKREALYYDGGTRPYRKITSIFDAKGNEIEIIYYLYERGKFVEEERHKIEYNHFDKQDNWTQKTVYKRFAGEPNGRSFPEYIEYRTIIYHQ